MGYFSTWTESAEGGLRLFAAYLCIALLFMLGSLSFTIPVAGAIKAPFLLMAIYYWSIYRPTLIPPWFVFIIGILADLISSGPLGLNAMVFVAAQWFVTDQRRFLMGQSFIVLWIGFLILCLAAGLIEWAVFALFSDLLPPVRSLLFSAGFGVALFPAICLLLHLTHKLLPDSGAGFVVKPKSR